MAAIRERLSQTEENNARQERGHDGTPQTNKDAAEFRRGCPCCRHGEAEG
jgi:hypothetical protein